MVRINAEQFPSPRGKVNRFALIPRQPPLTLRLTRDDKMGTVAVVVYPCSPFAGPYKTPDLPLATMLTYTPNSSSTAVCCELPTGRS
jgi:hypothetical protein